MKAPTNKSLIWSLNCKQYKIDFLQNWQNRTRSRNSSNGNLLLPRRILCIIIEWYFNSSHLLDMFSLLINIPVTQITRWTQMQWVPWGNFNNVERVIKEVKIVFCVAALVLATPPRQRSTANGQLPEQHLPRERRHQVRVCVWCFPNGF